MENTEILRQQYGDLYKGSTEKALERKLGLNEGIQAFQKTIVEIVKSRFPTLTELAQQRVAQIQKLDDLQQLVVQLSTARNQTAARRILKNGFID